METMNPSGLGICWLGIAAWQALMWADGRLLPLRCVSTASAPTRLPFACGPPDLPLVRDAEAIAWPKTAVLHASVTSRRHSLMWPCPRFHRPPPDLIPPVEAVSWIRWEAVA